MKYNKKRADKLLELVATGKHKLQDVFEMVDISKQTFYNWKNDPKLDFFDRLQEAEDMRLDVIKERAISGLYKLVDTYEYEEVKTDYKAPAKEGEKAKILGQTRTKKTIMPNPAMIGLALTNLESHKFKNRNHVDHTSDGKAFSFGNFLMDASTQVVDYTETTPAA